MAVFQPILPDSQDICRIASELERNLGISPVTSRVLVNRGIFSVEQARDFLNPSLDKLFNPFDLQDMDKAVRRIEQAIKEEQRITVYGDYDVDGMTAASVVYSFLRRCGCNVDVYLPDRHDEGYGINKSALETIHKRGTNLLISVDCGITAIEETDYARELGMDVIITDHHQCGATLPNAIAVLNPRRNPNLYDEYQLAGVGVAGKLVHALGGLDALREYLDMIALGTIADVVPLKGENRILASKGLEKINTSPCPGIQALIDVSRLEKGKVDAGSVAFGLAPRLNAAGRIAHPMLGFSLLTAGTLEKAMPIAQQLEENNRLRQAMEVKVIKEAEEIIHSNVDLSRDYMLILAHEDWDSGVIGIAASKLTERYNRPCILISISQEEGTGSARSIEGFDLYEALYSCKDLFLRFGGHQQAAGFSVLKDNIGELRERLLDYARCHISEEMLVPRFYYDMALSSTDIDYNLINELHKLEPFGAANQFPSFLLNDASIEDSRKVGHEGKHLKLSIGLGQRLWDGIAFNMGAQSEFLEYSHRMSILAGLGKNEWKGISKIQFLIRHMEMFLKTKEDCMDFLKPFYFKFFDAFFACFMYNKQKESNKLDTNLKNTGISIPMDELFFRLKNSRIGHLLLINTYEMATEVLNRFAAEGLLSEMAISYGNVNISKGIGVNSCILAPSIHEIPYGYYKNVYVFDKEQTFWEFHGLQGWVEDKKCILVGSPDGVPGNQWSDFRVSRMDFVSLYKWLQTLTPGRNLWQNWDELLSAYQKVLMGDINGFQMRIMLAVFEELEFIQVSSGYRFVRIECNQSPAHRKLEESRLYCFYNAWIGSK